MSLLIDNSRTENGRVGVSGVTPEEGTGADRTSVKRDGAGRTDGSGAYAFLLSGADKSGIVYEEQGKTAGDVMRDAGQIDVAVQKNYLAVMSGTMSAEDFARLQEDGTAPGQEDLETVVTIVDEIKASLLRGGNAITGYTDDLDEETLEKITGSKELAGELLREFHKYDIPVTEEKVRDVLEACGRAAGLGEISADTGRYLIVNHMEPTIDNIYFARHAYAGQGNTRSGVSLSEALSADRAGGPGNGAGGGYYREDGYYTRRAENFEWGQLRPQMEKVIENSGLAVTKQTVNSAKWLVEQGIPLNEENLISLYELARLDLPKDMTDALPAAAAAVHDGKSAMEGNLCDMRTASEKAVEYAEAFRVVSDEAAERVTEEGKTLNLRNLQAAQTRLTAEGEPDKGTPPDRARKNTASQEARRQLEEIRLKMTVEANLRLLRKGIRVETEELGRLVEELAAAQEERDRLLFGSGTADSAEERAARYRDTLAAASALPGLPAAVAGRFAVYRTADDFTLEGVYREGSALKAAYEKAGVGYETLMTTPRADLGDSIQKAFRNVDDILREMNLDVSEANQRAVRILGYNRMEVSEDNILAVKSADTTIRRVTEKMTPAAAMRLIREGNNPLSMDMEELEAYLGEQPGDAGQDFSKYAEYLYKLQKNENVTEAERDSYIGIYRLFRQIEKGDGAAIGALVGQGALLTPGNLLSAVRSGKKHGMDVTVDDDFGGVTSSLKGKSITEQITGGFAEREAYQKKLAADIFDHLDGGKMTPQMLDDNLTLEELSALLREARQNEDADRAYARDQASQLRAAGKTEEAVIKELLAFDQPVTADHLLAGGLLLRERGKLAGRMKELADKTDRAKALEESVGRLQESLEDEESAQKAFEGLERTYSDILSEAVYGEETGGRIDIREILNLHKQLSLLGSMAKEENYEVPVEIDGRMTSINLKIIRGGEESGRVTASMETQELGKVMAQFHIAGRDNGAFGLSGYIACDREQTKQKLEQSGETLKKALEQSDINVNSLHVICNEELDPAKAAAEAGRKRGAADGEGRTRAESRTVSGTAANVASHKLYQAARAFIGYIRKGEGISDENML